MSTFLPQLPALPLLVDNLQQTVDSLGNIFDSSGYHIGVVQGSKADIGGAGTSTGTTAPAAPVTTAPAANTPIIDQALNALKNTGKKATGAVTDPVGTIASLMFTSRFIYLWVGFILVVAGLFQFRQTQTVIQGATKAAKKGAEILTV